MKHFSNVLWVTDGKSENKLVIQRILAVIKKFNSKLTLVHIIDEPPSELAIFSGQHRSEIKKKGDDFLQRQVTKSNSSLQKIVATLKKNGVRANFKVITGKEFVEIYEGSFGINMTW